MIAQVIGVDNAPGPGRVWNDFTVLPSGKHLPRTGYPFMKLAQLHGVDYGDVLVASEPYCNGAQYQLCRRAYERLPDACIDDLDFLMRLPVSERGGPPT